MAPLAEKEAATCITHMGLDVQQAHFVLGEDGAHRVQTRPVVVAFILTVLNKPGTEKSERGRRRQRADEKIALFFFFF